MDDNFFMDLAFREAFKYIFLTYPNPAVGAVVVRNGAILAIEAHKKAGLAHAEVNALLKAYNVIENKNLDFNEDAEATHKFLLSLPKGFFKDCEIFVTLEPCSHIGKTPSCAMLLRELGLKRVVIGSTDPISSHSGGLEMLKGVSQIKLGVLQEKCDYLIEPFKIWQERSFVLFKIAQTSNGQIGGGYISSKESLTHTHKMREVCTKLLIGGNTIRVDRPTLDSRFSGGKAPNIAIYSKSDDFDRDIALFNVPNRSVEVIDNLDFLKQKGFVLVEGGEGMLKALQKKIDWMLIYQAPKLSCKQLSYNIEESLQFLHIEQGKDIKIWSRFGE